MKRTRPIALSLLTVIALVSGLVWWISRRDRADEALVLYGNVDLRQVELPFNNSERLAAVLVEEGDRIQQGQVLARLDTARLELQLAQAEAQAAAQRQIVERLHNGSRPEEIAQARANVESARADAANARREYERARELIEQRAISQKEFDDAKAGLEVAEARLAVNQKGLELALAGPRREEIAEAEARLKAAEAQVGLLRQVLKDAELVAPMNAVVRARIMEPGEMTSPQKPVLSLAITDPKWVRAYVSETDLGHLRPGMPASVAIDSFPGHRFTGWVGFISPVAEFTPKAVQTAELRTSLVYEVRVFVNDPQDTLRLGMPATVRLDAASGPAEERGFAASGATAETTR